MLLTATSSANFAPCPAGAYLARCVLVADLGTCMSEWQGTFKHVRKLALSWEILDEDVRRDDGEPFILGKRYTASLHEKAALRKELASWRGRDFTAEELSGFDPSNVLGTACMLNVVHSEKNDRTYANIATLMRAPKGSAVPEAKAPLLLWSMEAPDWNVFAKLPKHIVAQVSEAPEFKRLDPPESVTLPPAAVTAPAAPAMEDVTTF